MSQFTKLNEEEKDQWNKAIDYALEKLYLKDWDSKNNSKKFDVVYKEKLLPPKQVIGLAFEYLSSKNIGTAVTRIQGGDEDTNSFLKDFGLEIVFKKRNLKYYLDQIDVWRTWKDNYNKFVPDFIKEASELKDWSKWDKSIFYEFFERSNQQCVSSLKQGYFTKEEQLNIKEHWLELAPQMQAIALQQDRVSFKDFELLKKNIRKYTVQDRRAATSRLIASLQPNNLCTIVNHSNLNELIHFLNKNVENANLKFSGNWFESSNAVLDFFKKESGITDPYELITYPWQLLDYFKGNHHQKEDNDMSEENLTSKEEKELKLLKYKKQIILQGPPGTGKTRLAKKLARELCKENRIVNSEIPKEIDKDIIGEFCSHEVDIKSARDGIQYTILGITDIGVKVKTTIGTIYIPKYDEIKSMYNARVWQNEGKLKGGNDSYSAAVAKFIYDEMLYSADQNFLNQVKLIQFHPSYTYEDFVRGIVSKPNDDGDGVLYEAENKILADFAQKAFVNYEDSQYVKVTNVEKDVFEAFIDSVKEELANNEQHKYPITEAVYLFTADETRFKYKGDNWVAHHKGLNMKFSELKKIIDSGAKERQDVTKMVNLEELTRQHATYFIKVVEKYKEFKGSYSFSSDLTKQIELKNYVLIIDEINRANLSSVLGELIYALEYRGEAVESMYAVEGDNKLVLPPNLFIIGTMNTADRSVGHIDYAIRRRFAFVDVLPKDLSKDEDVFFDSELFQQVKKLFTTDEYETRSIYLSQEFEPKDVTIGHSYFIDKANTGGSMGIRLEYEIKPILLEYVKDGVLKVNAIPVINSLEASV